MGADLSLLHLFPPVFSASSLAKGVGAALSGRSWASGCSIEGSFQVIAVCHNAVRVLGFAGFRLVGLCIAGHGVQVFHGLLPKGFRVQAASLQGSGPTPRSRPGALKKNTLGSR